MADSYLIEIATDDSVEYVVKNHTEIGTPLIFSFALPLLNEGDLLMIASPPEHPYCGTQMRVTRQVSEAEYIAIFGFKPRLKLEDEEYALFEVVVD